MLDESVINGKHSRRETILALIEKDGKVNVADLCERLNTSAVTIRKDLDELEHDGLARRIHGGAISMRNARPETNYFERMSIKHAEKLLIARATAELVSDGNSIILNAGSTSAYVLDELKNKHGISIITNSLTFASSLATCANITTFFLGGKVVNTGVTIGDSVIEQLSKYTADKLIMGMDGVDPRTGATSYNHVEDYILPKMIARAKEKILVVDDSKIGRSTLVRIADLSAFDIIVTNYTEGNKHILHEIEQLGVRVIAV